MTGPSSAASAYYQQISPTVFVSTEHAQGAWSADQQHMSPVGGLLVSALESCSPRHDLLMSRVVYDILGLIPAGEVTVTAEVIRPGRTIELVEAEMVAAGRPVVRATAWRLATSDTSAFAGSPLAPIAGPESATPMDVLGMWPGGYIRSLEVRVVGTHRPGSSTVWIRTGLDLIAGRATTPVERIFTLIDTANGVAARANPGELAFPNTDLSVHLFRRPVGEWLGLQTEVSFGSTGVGLTSAVLHDVEGPIGRSAQTLTLRAL